MTQSRGEKEATEGREEGHERWSAQRKIEVVLRLLRREDLVEVSREVRVAPPQLEECSQALEAQLRPEVRDPH